MTSLLHFDQIFKMAETADEPVSIARSCENKVYFCVVKVYICFK